MSIEWSGFDELQANIAQIGPRATKVLSRQILSEAYKMRDLARKFAPIDEGNLEEAIQLRQEGGERDERGRFGRKSWTVYVDTSAAGSNGAMYVGEYAYIMHEHLTPYGPFKLGKNSQAKQAGQFEMVGGGYLDRAAEEVSRGIMNRLIEVTRSEIG